MHAILTIIRKEILDTVRDKRTVIFMIIMPLLLFPLIFSFAGRFAAKQQRENKNKVLTVAVLSSDSTNMLVKNLRSNSLIKVKNIPVAGEADSLMLKDQADLALLFPHGFNDSLSHGKSTDVKLYFRSTENWKMYRVQWIIKKYESVVVQNRIKKLGITGKYIHPIDLQLIDKAPSKEKFGKTIGGFIPYLFIIFCFLGCMYPAIDLFAGEKERGTIETLFTLPVTRLQLLVGKLIVVAVSGLLSAILAILGLFISIRTASMLPADLVSSIHSILNAQVVIQILCMMVPFSLFIASVLVMLSSYARNYKEAQSSISPLTILVIFPSIIGLMPGVKYSLLTALLPVINISLATKEIISGTASMFLYSMTLLSLLLFSVLGIWLSLKWFLKENVIMRV